MEPKKLAKLLRKAANQIDPSPGKPEAPELEFVATAYPHPGTGKTLVRVFSKNCGRLSITGLDPEDGYMLANALNFHDAGVKVCENIGAGNFTLAATKARKALALRVYNDKGEIVEGGVGDSGAAE